MMTLFNLTLVGTEGARVRQTPLREKPFGNAHTGERAGSSQLIETSLRGKLKKKYGENPFFSIVAYWTGKFNYIFVSWFGFSRVFFFFQRLKLFY